MISVRNIDVSQRNISIGHVIATFEPLISSEVYIYIISMSKKLLVLLLMSLLLSICAFAQSSSNYVFTTASDASLTDMSSGTTQVVAPNTDGLNTGVFSGTNPIGFTFYFMSMPYDQFVVTEDGVMRLGTSLASISRTPEITVNEPRLLPFSSDMATGSNGKVHYKTTGVAPNRICIVEWLNLHISFPNSLPVTGNSTFQIRIYEATGVIEYIYGYMFVTRANPYGNCSTPINNDFGAIGFCNTNANNGLIYKSVSFSSSNVGTTIPPVLLPNSSIECVGTNNIEVAGLSSSTNGARRIYTFTPPAAPAAPTSLSYSGITQSSVTLHWIDNASNETHYHVYRSDDGGTTYELALILAANTTTSGPISGLPDKTYYWKVFAVNEGNTSSALEGNCTTQPAGTVYSTVAGGLWSQTATWEGGVLPGVNDDVIIRDAATVTIDITTAVCNNLTVGEGASGHLTFIAGGSNATLTCDGDVWVKSGATFDVVAGASGGTRKLILGQRFYSNSNLKVDGTFDMDLGGFSIADVEFRGIVNGEISGTGPVCDFYSITVNKGTGWEKYIDAVRVITINAPAAAGNRITLTNGTFRLSSASALTPWYGAQTICEANGRIWINHASGSIQCVGSGTATGAGNVTINGKVQVTAGTFAYGSGANTCTVNGTLEVDGADGVVNIFGKLYFAGSGYCNIFNGNVNVDPQAGANLAAGRVVEFPNLTTVLFSGGVMTIVDPNANAGSTEFYIQNNEQNKFFTGATIRFGDGVSSTTGNANGFTIQVPGQYGLDFGNVIVNNPAGSNRTVRMSTSSAGTPTIEDLNIIAGTFNLNGVAVSIIGTTGLTNNGTLLATTANSRINFFGTSPQIYTGTGTLTTSNLTTQINNAAGVTLDAPYSTMALIMTNGLLNTTATNLIQVTGTSAANVSGGGSSSYVNGPFARNIVNGAATWVFPVGKSSYTFFEILNPSTAGTVMIQAEVFDADCGGSIVVPAGHELNTSRYWFLQAISGAAFNSATFRINEVNPTTNMILTRCATVNGTYTSIHGSQAGSTITSAAATAGLGYFCAAAPAFLSGIYYVGTGQPFLSLTENTLNGFFRAVNSSGLKGDVTLIVTSDITETGAVAINEWAEINGSGHTIKIVPQDAVLKTFSGNVGTDFGMIRLNGADGLTFDGAFSGSGRYLRFRNTNAGYPVFGFINEATYDTLKSIIIESPNTSTNNSRRGSVIFGTSTAAGTLGNSFNVVTDCELRDRSDAAGVPHTHVYSFGTAGKLNVTNKFSGNEIYNFTTNAFYINTTGCGNDWVIEDNHFYQTASRSGLQTAIDIRIGANHTVSGNFIGGNAVNCGGAAWTNTGNVAVIGISIASSAGDPVSVQGNTIQNFSLTGGTGVFTGITVTSGPCNIGTVTGNLIGHASTANSIAIAGNTVNSGIRSNSTSSVSIWNNTVANITCSNSGTTNTLVGIWQSGTGSGNISHNTVHSLSSASTRSSINDMALQGVYHSGASAGSTYITENTVYNLSLTNTTNVQINVAGISVTAVSNPIINRNNVWGLSNASTRTTAATPPTACGISVYRPSASSTVEIRNNMVSMGSGQTTNTEFIGIWLQSSTNAYTANINYNSIALSGAPSGGALPSFALLRGDNSATTQSVSLSMRNNIFSNSRSGGTGRHYAVGNQGGSPATNWNSASSNYNLYVGSAADNVALWNAANCNIATFRTNTGGDASSWAAIGTTGASDYANVNLSNLFTDLSNGDMHIRTNQPEAWFVNGKGVQHTLNNDIDGDSRSTLVINGATDIGADEFTPTSTPIAAGQTGSIANASTTTYTFAGRTLAEITWEGSGFPSAINLYYYTQRNPDLNDGFGIPYPNLVGSKYSNCVWDIQATGGNISNYDYNLKLYFDDALIGILDDLTDTKIAKNPYRFPDAASAEVDDYGVYPSTYNAGAKSYVITDVVGFSKFILYQGTAVPLPVNLVTFDAYCSGNDITLEWLTNSELNNAYFTLEKSYDCVMFHPVAEIEGAGTTNKPTLYLYVDDGAVLESQLTYYRLKQTDYDGKSTLSEIIFVKCRVDDIESLNIGFEPERLVVYFTALEGSTYTIQLFDNAGRILFSEKHKIEEKYAEIPVTIGHLAHGAYNIVIVSDNTVKSKKFVIVR